MSHDELTTPTGKQVFERSSKRVLTRDIRKDSPSLFSYHANWPDSDGVLFRHLVTIKGSIHSIVIDIGKFVGKGALYFTISNDLTSADTKILNPSKGRFTVDSGLPVKGGDKVSMKFVKSSETDEIGDVYIAFQFEKE